MMKSQVWLALKTTLERRRSECQVTGDGVKVEIDAGTDYEPDVLLNCGAKTDAEDTTAPSPVIIVDVLSPSTARIDAAAKLDNDFRLPSVWHYLLVSMESARVVHRRRQHEGTLLTAVHTQGRIDLDLPGISFDVAEFHRGTDLAQPAPTATKTHDEGAGPTLDHPGRGQPLSARGTALGPG